MESNVLHEVSSLTQVRHAITTSLTEAVAEHSAVVG